MKSLIDIISVLSHLIGQVEESAEEQFKYEALTHTQMHYLESINTLVNPNITELAAYLKLTKPTVKVAVDKLIEKNYVFKVKSDTDRRSSHLHLTDKGKFINQMHDYAHKKIADIFTKKLDTNEIKQLNKLLSKVISKE